MMKNEPLLSIKQLSLAYEKRVVADLSLAICQGEILALAGESGCGKTTVLSAVLGLSKNSPRVVSGLIRYDGQDLNKIKPKERRSLAGREIGMIYQNPGAAFNPIRTYRKQFTEMIKSLGFYEKEKTENEILALFARLNLPDGKRILDSCPYELSGGMNQRVAIAAAMLPNPRLLLADESTSALDVTTQKQVVEELQNLREMAGMTMLLVTHNLGVAAKLSDMLGIMYAGRLMEYGETKKVLKNPLHPYTRGLLAAIPTIGGKLPEGLDGQPPLYGPDQCGCAFSERCMHCGKACKEKEYRLIEAEPGHFTSCMEGADE